MESIPLLRLIGGVLLVLAGLVAFLGVDIGPAAILLLAFGGVVIVLVVYIGHRPRPWDVVTFVVGILALAAAATSYGPYGIDQNQPVIYSAPRSQIPSNTLSLSVSSSTGSVDVSFSNNDTLGYQVTFTRSIGVFPLLPGGAPTVASSVRGDAFLLNVSSNSWAVTVILGRGFMTNIAVSSDTGSVSLAADDSDNLRNVSLTASTGSVEATIAASSIQGLTLRAYTGSVSLTSSHLGTAGRMVPISLSTSTGSVSISATIDHAVAARVNASTDLGSITHNLVGFSITQDASNSLRATEGNIASASQSFDISATANLGSVSLNLNA